MRTAHAEPEQFVSAVGQAGVWAGESEFAGEVCEALNKSPHGRETVSAQCLRGCAKRVKARGPSCFLS